MTVQAFDLVTSQPWLITEEALQTIVAIAERTNDIDALAARVGRPLVNTRRVEVRDSVAIIPITGPIFRYANLFSEISGATSTEALAKDIRTAVDDPLIESIVLEVNSPGGAAAGINELADMIFQARQDKTIIAYGDGQVSSAAYWLASAADLIVVDRTAVLGSIGVRMTIQDTSGREQRAGVRVTQIISSQSPDKDLDPSLDESRAKLQKIVDDLAEVFVGAVARNRDTTVETVLEKFGRGGSIVGQRAVDAGMADRIGSLEEVIAELQPARAFNRRTFNMVLNRKGADFKGPITVKSTDELRAALEAGHTVDEVSLATVDVAALTAAANKAGRDEAAKELAETHKTATAEAVKAAVATERTRISGLQAIAVKGFENEIQAAVESGASVEATAIEISKLARTRGVTVAALAGDAPGAVKHGGKGSGAPSASDSPWSKITAKFNKPKRA